MSSSTPRNQQETEETQDETLQYLIPSIPQHDENDSGVLFLSEPSVSEREDDTSDDNARAANVASLLTPMHSFSEDDDDEEARPPPKIPPPPILLNSHYPSSPGGNTSLSSCPEVSLRGAPALGLTQMWSMLGGGSWVPLVSIATSNPRSCKASTNGESSCSRGSPPVHTTKG